MSKEQDRLFFRNYSIVIGILAVMILLFIILARIIGSNDTAQAKQLAARTAKNTAPVAEVRIAGEEQPGQAPVQTAAAEPAAGGGMADHGKQVYSGLCISCHGTGIPGIPQFGDAPAWADRIAQGKDVLYGHVINGFTGKSGIMMPPKGGNPALTDDEIKAAVDYMVANSQ
ncbi:MAG: c-type cytochrome [Gammaproteobacteria bacterium]